MSLDQFRGYTVAGMLLVNYLGGYAACPQVLRHSHDHISYADTIMPHFLFAVGFAFRLTFGRRSQLYGTAAAYTRVVRRMLGLVLVSLVIYTVTPRAESWQSLTELGVWGAIADPLKRNWFQTLMHIAVTGLWLTPVIRASATARVLWMIGSGVAHVFLSGWFNFNWVHGIPSGPTAIDGGPLAFLTWVIPAGAGTLACDAICSRSGRPQLVRMLLTAAFLMALGYALSCGTRLYDVPPEQMESARNRKLAGNPVWPTAEQLDSKLKLRELEPLLAEPPFVSPPGPYYRKWNYWMMSLRGATISYLTFSAGLSVAVYLVFHLLCDRAGWQLAFFRTFGTNALAAYVLHELVSTAVKPFVPRDVPGWYLAASLLTFFWITWVLVRSLEKQGIYIKV